MPNQETKTCPFCSEEIKFSAVKCKHCGEFLNERPANRKASQTIEWVDASRSPKAELGPEQTLWEAKPDYRCYLPAWLFSGLCWFLSTGFFLIAIRCVWDEGNSFAKQNPFATGLFFLVLGACNFAFAWIHRNSITYRRTTQRIVREWGILSSQASEVKVADITAMNLKQYGFDSQFGTGNIELCTSGTSGVEVYLRAVPNAKQVREEIRRARDAYGANT